MRDCLFQGVGTALITPFRGEEVDYDAFGRLIDFQIENGVAALIVAGTTGESPALTGEEYRKLISLAAEKAAGRIPVIAGAGSNVTAHAIEKGQQALAAGADGLLLVTPYYNKTTQQGLAAHFRAIADACAAPCILYNVPSRTGLNLGPEAAAELAKHPRIAAIKEASGNISQVANIRRLCGDQMAIYSGCDDQTLPVLSLGGRGIISVASNVLPRQMSEMCRRWFAGDAEGAARLQIGMLDIMNQLMIETNPIPVKAACAHLGYGENRLRLPLVPMTKENEEKLLRMLEEAQKL